MLEQAQITRLLDIANFGCNKGLVHEARIIYENILIVKPGHAPARIGLAMSHIAVDDFETAEEMLRDILADSPDDVDARTMLGLCLSLSGRKDEAREQLEQVVSVSGASARLASSLLEQMD